MFWDVIFFTACSAHWSSWLTSPRSTCGQPGPSQVRLSYLKPLGFTPPTSAPAPITLGEAGLSPRRLGPRLAELILDLQKAPSGGGLRRGCRHSLLLVFHGLDDASAPDLRPQLLHGCLAAGHRLHLWFAFRTNRDGELALCPTVPKEDDRGEDAAGDRGKAVPPPAAMVPGFVGRDALLSDTCNEAGQTGFRPGRCM